MLKAGRTGKPFDVEQLPLRWTARAT